MELNLKLKVRKLSDSLSPQIKRINQALGIAGRRKILQMAGEQFQKMARSTFGAGNVVYRGNAWPKYSPSYTKKIGRSTPTLFRTGKLKASIRLTAPRGNSIGIYTNLPYSAVQFLGGGNTIPSRKYFPMEGRGSMWRLTWKAEKDLVLTIGRGMVALSGGTLPRPTGLENRSKYAYGNPLTP